jgi:hypothetical protein
VSHGGAVTDAGGLAYDGGRRFGMSCPNTCADDSTGADLLFAVIIR